MLVVVFGLIGLALIVVIGLVVVGRETARLAIAPRPAVFDMEEAVEFIADRISAPAQGRLSHEDVRWILLADADLLEEASVEPEGRFPWSRRPTPVPGRTLDVVDQDLAVARILAAADESNRDLADADIAEVLDQRLVYLERIGAIGGQADPAEVDEADDVDPADPADPVEPPGDADRT